MGKLFIYGGIIIGGMIGAYAPVMLFHASSLGLASIVGGIFGSFAGLWAGYKAFQNFDD